MTTNALVIDSQY